ncbi:WD repeat-containing protein 53 [Hypsizygus marmoreus]|uniref:WD repeat-containing protein 53 n=1 Tax=Hypsizygus marmoreus TaxID=39966 RepID=A0A369JSD8_HYPMA|nr:WD repeat-containing protein 53 [Hypsizygus marmoreus]
MHLSEPFEPSESYNLQHTLEIPSHVCSLAFGHAGHLFTGSEDGTLRVYDLSSFKVLKAVRGLGSEVSSIVCIKRPNTELRDVWLACGKRVMKFQMDSPKMIQTAEDALVVIEVGEESSEDDILNEIAINANKTHLAFCMDSGVVGVIEISTKQVTRMKSNHDSVCGSVKFIPDRPREIVSGGYDTTLRHFDFLLGNILSSHKVSSYTTIGGMALAPPFVMSMAISSTGLVVAGTADGRVWIGCGGYKKPASKAAKKKRKWEGLNSDEATEIKVAEGPIVALAFDDRDTLTLSTLLGVIMRCTLIFDEKEGSVALDRTWQKETESIEKVNALVTDEKRVIIGGLTADGGGVFEIWRREGN